MARHAFISHSHRDADAAMQILAALEQRGVKCWTAPRDVPPGGSYAEAILTAIENASCFVLVYTENSNVSPHVLREVERALSLGINIMPVRFDGSSVSKSLDYLLATVHWLSVIGEPRSASIDHAAERIAACVVEKSDAGPPLREVPPPAMSVSSPVPPPLPATPAPARPVGSGALLLWIGLLLLAVAGVIFAVQTVRHALPKENSTVAATASSGPADTAAAAAQIASVAATPPTIPAPIVPPIPEPPAPPSASEPVVAEETPAAEERTATAENEAGPETTPPPLAQNIARLAPVDVVKRYFGYLSDHNTIKAYELLSTDYRTRENFVTYTRNFASTETLRLVSAHAVSTRGDVASVEVTFDKKNRKFGWIRWRGPIQLTADPSGWRINSVKGLRASSLRR